jgi:CBS domain containing-hemolysin-like protein
VIKIWHLRHCIIAALLLSQPAQASLFQGETLDAVANGISWAVLVIVPVTGIVVFWLVHILPEKIAEQKNHPQAKAIQVLCLLSLAFGGLLWPLAWLWAYSKPVLYKMAYGTDVVEHGADAQHATAAVVPDAESAREAELQRLRAKVAELEKQLPARAGSSEGGA